MTSLLKIVLFSFSLCYVVLTGAYAQDEHNRGLQANFTQERFLTGFDQPIKSSGRFYLYPKNTVVWETEKPFASKMLISSSHVVQYVNGQQGMKLPLIKFAALDRIQSLFQATLAGNAKAVIEDMEDAAFTETNDQWTLILQAPVGQQNYPYQEISITGNDFIEEVIIQRSHGDHDVILLTDHQIISAQQLPHLPEVN